MDNRLRYLLRKPSRHGTLRWYVRLPGKPLIRIPIKTLQDPRLGPLYAAALAGELSTAAPPSRGSLRELCAAYSEFLKDDTTIAERTKYVRRRHIEELCQEPVKKGDPRTVGDMPVSAFTAASLQVLLDRRRATPEAANDKRKCVAAMFVWAVPRGLAKHNPAAATKRIKTKSDGWATWSLKDIRQYAERHPPGTPAFLAMALLLYTGQRRGDVIRFSQQHVRDGAIHFVQQKGKREMVIPILPSLKRLLPKDTTTFLINGLGKPFTSAGFGNWFRDRCNEAGLKGLAAHGLRKALQAIGADAGLTDRQLMAIAGHETAKETTRYTQGRDRALLAKSGMKLLENIQFVPPPNGGTIEGEKVNENNDEN